MEYTFNNVVYRLTTETDILAECKEVKEKAYALCVDYVARADAAAADAVKALEAVRTATETLTTANKAYDAAKAKVYAAWKSMRDAEADAKAAKKDEKPAKADAVKAAALTLAECEKNAEVKADAVKAAEDAKSTAYATNLTATTLRDAHLKAAKAAVNDYNGMAVAEVMAYAKAISRTMHETNAEDIDRRSVLRAYWFSHRTADGIAIKVENNAHVVSSEAIEISFAAFDRAFHIAANKDWMRYIKILVNNIHRNEVEKSKAEGQNVSTIAKPLPAKLVALRNSDEVFTAYATNTDLKNQMQKIAAFMFDLDAPAFIGGTAFRDFKKAIDQFKTPPAGVDEVAWETRNERVLAARFTTIVLATKAGKATNYVEDAMYSKSDIEVVDA